MKSFFAATLSAATIAIALAGPAEAKRRGFFSIPSGEAVVFAQDLPNKPELLREDGSYVDLGYHFTRTGGEWVGYIGSDDSYLPLDEMKLKMLMMIAGVSELPPVPARPASSMIGVGLMWVGGGFLILCAIIGVLGKLKGRMPSAPARVPAPAPMAPMRAQPQFNTGAPRATFGRAS